MNAAVWIAILAGGAIALFVAWLVLLETSIRVEPGTLALLLKRGKATGRAVGPGRHFVTPWSKLTMQVYPSRELTLVGGGPPTTDPRVEYVDDPLAVILADRAAATVSYTARCQLEPTSLKDVHDRFGPEGIWPALRDATRAALMAELQRDTTVDDAFEPAPLEERCSSALAEALAKGGFTLRGFSLRAIDLGETGAVIQETVRAKSEAEREQALADVRRLRIVNDAALVEDLGVEADLLLRYRQLEAWRDVLQRWNGTQPIPPLLTSPLSTPLPLEVDTAHAESELAQHSAIYGSASPAVPDGELQ